MFLVILMAVVLVSYITASVWGCPLILSPGNITPGGQRDEEMVLEGEGSQGRCLTSS